MKRHGKFGASVVLMIVFFASLFMAAPAQAAITSSITIANTSGYGVNMRPAPNLWGAPVGNKGTNSVTLDDINHLSMVTSISSGNYPNVSE
ncbi:MAG: hypothetical protein PVI21_06465 [Candidatus Woesebacteria bacterium]|jgi:hypothetical protein